ncbi:MAG: 3-oxoadipate enol-lactonase [Acidisphaera sp.]|nr:3-oxoadipate enol-lactonase [Acidisphaera sp.]MBV9811868.1 3-oxoadipate enol-lactonase [Acetobacteraceae bacterium]
MFVHVGDLDVHVQVSGPSGAPALLLLHSLGTNLHVWDAQAEALSERFRVVRPDMRGHGLTSVTAGPYEIAGLARDALAVLDMLGIARAHVAGISIGGMIAQALAAEAPGRVLSLILCDTAMAIPPPELWRERAGTVRTHGMAPLLEPVIARWVTPGFRTNPAARGLEAMLLRTSPEGYAGAAEAIARADLAARTRTLTMPALVLVGERDEATPPTSGEALAQAIKGARFQMLPNAAHIPTVEQPAAVTEAMRAFLTPSAGDPYEAGLAVRRAVLGEAHVARSLANVSDFDRAFQHFITRSAWGGVWTRPGLDRRTRSLLTLVMLASLGHHEELRLHLRATRNTGASENEVAEALLQVAVYGGVPAANTAFRIAKETFAELRASEEKTA